MPSCDMQTVKQRPFRPRAASREKLEVTLVETKTKFEVWVSEYKFADFNKNLSGRFLAVKVQHCLWEFINHLARSYPIRAVRKNKKRDWT